ncbi:MAG: hypothetical protein HC923_01545 [Myxococcales bacterium]|nr:hypothetical protein [Myxococcales bacterium]
MFPDAAGDLIDVVARDVVPATPPAASTGADEPMTVTRLFEEEPREEVGALPTTSPTYTRVEPGHIVVDLPDRSSVDSLWKAGLRSEGLYVPFDVGVGQGHPIVVDLRSPFGEMRLRARVVYVAVDETGAVDGVGAQVEEGRGGWKARLEAFLGGRRTRIDEENGTDPNVLRKAVHESVERARRFLADARNQNFYAAVGVPATAPTHVVRSALAALLESFERASRTPRCSTRRDSSRRSTWAPSVTNAGTDETRLEYDFRIGLVLAPERLDAIGKPGGLSLEALCDAWNHVHPDRVERSATLARKAFAARQKMDFAAAIVLAEQALDLHPFFVELRDTLRVWKKVNDPTIGF